MPNSGATMTSSKYEVTIYWSDEDAAFVAEVSELPRRAAHGATQAKALASAQEQSGYGSTPPKSLVMRFQHRKFDAWYSP